MTPEIYQIPVASRATTQNDSGDSDRPLTGNPGDPNDRLTESGTIFGSDGNIYEYHYVRGIEPRKVVDLKREETKPGVWSDHYVARIVYEPVLIRVLRPAGSNRQDALDAANAAARANDGTTPDPCAPATDPTFRDENPQATDPRRRGNPSSRRRGPSEDNRLQRKAARKRENRHSGSGVRPRKARAPRSRPPRRIPSPSRKRQGQRQHDSLRPRRLAHSSRDVPRAPGDASKNR